MNRTRDDAERRQKYIQGLIDSGCPQYQPGSGEGRAVQLMPRLASTPSAEPEVTATIEQLEAKEYKPPGPNLEQRLGRLMENTRTFPFMTPLVIGASFMKTMLGNLRLLLR